MKHTALFIASILLFLTSCDPAEWQNSYGEEWFFKNATDAVLKVSHSKMDIQTVEPGDSVCILSQQKHEGNEVPSFEDLYTLDSIYVYDSEGTVITEWIQKDTDKHQHNFFDEKEWDHIKYDKQYIWTYSFSEDSFIKEEMKCYGGVYVNGEMKVSFKSAFAGGCCPDPHLGSSHYIYIHTEYYNEAPDWGVESEAIYFSGFYYTDQEYKSQGQELDLIKIYNIPEIGELQIEMQQGQYTGTNDRVKSVVINSYRHKADEIADINIQALLFDGTIIDIIYGGTIRLDKYV